MGQEDPGRMTALSRILLEAGRSIIRVPGAPDLLQALCRMLSGMEHYDRVRVTQRRDRILVTASDSGGGEAPPFFWEKHVMDGGRAVVNNDLAHGSDGRFGPWLSAALFPLRNETEIWGCLGIYSLRQGLFSDEEAQALEELSRDLETGLQTRFQDLRRRENEQFLSDMANLVPGLFYKLQYDPEAGLQFLYVSPGIDLLLPVSPGQVHADPGTVFRALHRADRRKFYQAGIRSRDFLTVFNLEFRLQRPNGAVVWVLATAFPQKREGTVVWTGLAIDVTPQNKLQEALQREQELLEVILDNIGDGVVAVDENGALALVNRTASRLLDKPADLPEGLPWPALDPALPWGAQEPFQPWYRTRADGSVLHLEAHVSDLTDANRRPRGRVLLLRDMTDRDRIEERLRQSEKLESIGLLAGGIAHDFNNLLTGVFGFIQLARMNSEHGEKVVSYLDHALGPFQRARTLTQQLLTFARGGEIAKVPLRVAELLPGILQFTLAGSPVTWDWEGEAPWTILANEAQIHQVFENLFLNARQAMPQGGQVRVRLTNVPAPGPPGRGLAAGDYLEVGVEDTGPGIPAENVSKIFDPFFTTKAGGTGLGLSICFSVLKKHGGCIEAENLPGGGACFRLFLPAQPLTPRPAGSG